MHKPLAPTWLLTALLALQPQHSQANALFDGADMRLGEQLLRTHRCADCHARHMGGDAIDIYNPKGRINSPTTLLGMVDRCAVALNLQLFPEEVSAMAAVLNRDHYRFPR